MTYNLSKDYDLLYKLLCDGHVIACFVDFAYRGDPKRYRDICKAKRWHEYEMQFQSRGMTYGSVDRWQKDKGSEKDLMIEECKRMNLEFIPI